MPSPRTTGVVCAVATSAIIAASTHAQDKVLYTGADGGFGATAAFSLSGDRLIVTFSNTSEFDVIRPIDVLTGLFFNVTSDVGDRGVANPVEFEPLSAVVPVTDSMMFGFTGNAGDVSGEWGFRDNLRRGFGGTQYGISSVAAGGFRVRDNFSDINVWGRRGLAFIDYSLTSLADDPNTGARAVRGRLPLAQSSVQFTFLAPENFELSDLEDVTAHFGTRRGHKTIELAQAIPAPGALMTVGTGLAFGLRRRRRAE